MKRFYKDVGIGPVCDGAFHILLDGKPVKTPAQTPLVIRGHALARAVAAEWAGQGAQIVADTMPLTQFATTVQDLAGDHAPAWRAQLHAYLDGDCLVYPAEKPEAIVLQQTRLWTPLRDAFTRGTGIALRVAEHLGDTRQDAAAHDVLDALLDTMPPARLFAWHLAAIETGSTAIGWHAAFGDTDVDDLVTASLIEELYNDTLASPDRSNPDPMLEKRIPRLRATLDAVRQFVGFVEV